jgi:hypothetical protein
MSERAAQYHWLDVHSPMLVAGADVHAYLVATRLATPDGNRSPLGMGCAEMWVEPGRLTALLQSDGFRAALADEPIFTAYWRSVLLLAEDHVSVPGPGPVVPQPAVKLQLVLKRRPGLSLAGFRERCRGGVDDAARRLPGVIRMVQSHAVDSSYAVGESPLDAALQLWFGSVEVAGRTLATPEFAELSAELAAIADRRHQLLTREYWFVVPGERVPTAPGGAR